jgi:hypothetical protein
MIGDRRYHGDIVRDASAPGIASVFRNRRQDSFNRTSAHDLWLPSLDGSGCHAAGNGEFAGNELPPNWMHQGRAGVKKRNT